MIPTACNTCPLPTLGAFDFDLGDFGADLDLGDFDLTGIDFDLAAFDFDLGDFGADLDLADTCPWSEIVHIGQ